MHCCLTHVLHVRCGRKVSEIETSQQNGNYADRSGGFGLEVNKFRDGSAWGCACLCARMQDKIIARS